MVFSCAGLEGIPVELFSSSEGTYGGLFVVEESGETGALPLQAITAIAFNNGVAYNPAITYIPKPAFPEGCDTNIITAIHDYLPLFTEVTIYVGTTVTITGIIYKNIYGMLVVADDTSGNNPVFIPVTNITCIIPSNDKNFDSASNILIKYKID